MAIINENKILPNTVNINSAYSVLPTDNIINCVSGIFIIMLPDVSEVGNQVFIIKNSGTGTITVQASGGALIDSVSSIAIDRKQSYSIQSNGTEWILI